MTTNRLLRLLSMAATCLLFTSCIDSSVPLSDPNTSKADERLAGVWRQRGESGQVNDYRLPLPGANFRRQLCGRQAAAASRMGRRSSSTAAAVPHDHRRQDLPERQRMAGSRRSSCWRKRAGRPKPSTST